MRFLGAPSGTLYPFGEMNINRRETPSTGVAGTGKVEAMTWVRVLAPVRNELHRQSDVAARLARSIHRSASTLFTRSQRVINAPPAAKGISQARYLAPNAGARNASQARPATAIITPIKRGRKVDLKTR